MHKTGLKQVTCCYTLETIQFINFLLFSGMLMVLVLPAVNSSPVCIECSGKIGYFFLLVKIWESDVHSVNAFLSDIVP